MVFPLYVRLGNAFCIKARMLLNMISIQTSMILPAFGEVDRQVAATPGEQ